MECVYSKWQLKPAEAVGMRSRMQNKHMLVIKQRRHWDYVLRVSAVGCTL